MKRSEGDSGSFDKLVVSSYPLPVSTISVEIEENSGTFASILATSVTPLGVGPAAITFAVQKTSGIVELLERSKFAYITQHPCSGLIDSVASRDRLTQDALRVGSTRVLKCEHKLVDDSTSNNLYVAHVTEYERAGESFDPVVYWRGGYHTMGDK